MTLSPFRQRIFYGWWVVFACFFFSFYSGGFVMYGFTAIFEPISREFGWSYANISLAASLRGLEIGLLSPLLGILVDKAGPRRLMVAGSLVAGAGLIFLSRISSLTTFYCAFFIIAIGISPSGATVQLSAVANWFKRKIGIVTGITASGFACGGLLLPFISSAIDRFGWRDVMFWAGIGMWAVGIPLALMVRHKPEQYGYLPDGESTGSGAIGSNGSADSDDEALPLGSIMKNRAFWQITMAATLNLAIIGSMMTHIMPYLSTIGMGRSFSSLIAGGIPVASIAGRMGFGWFADRFEKRAVAAIGASMLMLALLALSMTKVGGAWLLVPFLLFSGLSWGGNVTMRVSLLHGLFGRKRFATIMGFSTGLMMLGNIAGPPLAGWVFDRTGTYHWTWVVCAGLAVISALLFLKLPELQIQEISVGKE